MSGTPRLSTGASAVFATRVATLALTASTTLVLARLLAPAELGSYYLLVLVPPSLLALFSLGLPGALTYHAGRGQQLDEVRGLAVVLALAVSLTVAAILLAAQPFLTATVLAAAPAGLVPYVAVAMPGVFATSFAGAVILGRQRLRVYNALLLLNAGLLLIGQVVAIGVLHAGVAGALATYATVVSLVGLMSLIAMRRLGPIRVRTGRRFAASLVGYGLRLQPASLAGFFSYRADVYLMSILLRDPAALGVYGLAVNIAELVFYVPDAVSTVLFPRVAALGAKEAGAVVPTVSRTTLFITAVAAAAVALAALVALPFILPAYRASLAPMLILLPGIVGLSASKVLSGYLSGIGRPGPISMVAASALVLNLALNLALIPRFGPSGAAAASLVSYSANGAIMVLLGARQAGVGLREMILVRAADVIRLRTLVLAPAHRLRAR